MELRETLGGRESKVMAERWGLVLILALALGLRAWNITWGLPEIYEEAFPFRIALKFLSTGDLNPHFFNYPAFTFYFQFALQGTYYLLGRLFGFFTDLVGFSASLSGPVILARSATIAFDLGTVVMVYFLARRLAGSGAGLVAASLACVNPLEIRQSHLINVDTPLTFFAALSLLALIRIHVAPTMRGSILAGLWIGLAAASKYTGAYLLVPLVVSGWRAPKEMLIAALTAVGAFLAMNPYILLDSAEFFKNISYEQYHMSYGHLGLDPSQSTAAFYLTGVFPSVLNPVFFVIVILSAVAYAARKNRIALIILSFPIATMAIIGLWSMRADRYVLPLIPPLIAVGSAGLIEGWNLIAARIGGGRSSLVREGIPAAIAAVISLTLLQNVFAYQKSLSLPDTRALGKSWMESNLPRRSAYATGPYGIEFPKGMYKVVNIPFTPTESEGLAPFYDARWYQDLDLVIASDLDYSRFSKESKRFADILKYYDTLRTRWTLVHEETPGQGQSGPALWFYRPPAWGSKTDLFPSELFVHFSILAESSLVATFAENLASVLYSKGYLGKGEQLLRFALQLEPGNGRRMKELALILSQREEYSEALALSTRSLELDPARPEVMALRGRILLRLGRLDDAEADLRAAIAGSPALGYPYQDLESLYVFRHDYVKLVSILTEHRKIVADGSDDARNLDSQIQRLK